MNIRDMVWAQVYSIEFTRLMDSGTRQWSDVWAIESAQNVAKERADLVLEGLAPQEEADQ